MLRSGASLGSLVSAGPGHTHCPCSTRWGSWTARVMVAAGKPRHCYAVWVHALYLNLRDSKLEELSQRSSSKRPS